VVVDDVGRRESGHRRAFRTRLAATLAAAAVTAVLVGISWSWHPGRHRPDASPRDARMVSIRPLPGCARTDHRSSLRVALAVRNLTGAPLRLVSVDVAHRIAGLRLRGHTVGLRPCAEQERADGPRMRPAEQLVVALDFTVGPDCPPAQAVTARLGFDNGSATFHTDAADVVDLSSVGFDHCR
jgi:hypothetical protein